MREKLNGRKGKGREMVVWQENERKKIKMEGELN